MPTTPLERFVRVGALRRFWRMPRFEELAPDDFAGDGRVPDATSVTLPLIGRLHFSSNFKRPGANHFISHRWLSADHPDPDGDQLRQILGEFPDDSLVWYDFSCLPQEPRRELEEAIARIPDVISRSWFYVVGRNYDDFGRRAWCQFEVLCAINIGHYPHDVAVTSGDRSVNAVTATSVPESPLYKRWCDCVGGLPKRLPTWSQEGGYFIDRPDIDSAPFAPFRDLFFDLEAAFRADLEILWDLLRRLLPPQELDCTYPKY